MLNISQEALNAVSEELLRHEVAVRNLDLAEKVELSEIQGHNLLHFLDEYFDLTDEEADEAFAMFYEIAEKLHGLNLIHFKRAIIRESGNLIDFYNNLKNGKDADKNK